MRTFKESTITMDYYLKKYGKNALHGVYLVPSDLPSTISASTPLFAADKQLGIKEDAEFGCQRALAPVGVHAVRAGASRPQVHLRP